jgi:regulator of sigma E protease
VLAPFVLTVTTQDPVRVAPPAAPAGFLGILTGPDTTEISGVLPGSPAEIAGLRAGDRILEIDGTTVDSPRRLREVMQGEHAGNRLLLRVSRRGQTVVVQVVLKDRSSRED